MSEAEETPQPEESAQSAEPEEKAAETQEEVAQGAELSSPIIAEGEVTANLGQTSELAADGRGNVEKEELPGEGGARAVTERESEERSEEPLVETAGEQEETAQGGTDDAAAAEQQSVELGRQQVEKAFAQDSGSLVDVGVEKMEENDNDEEEESEEVKQSSKDDNKTICDVQESDMLVPELRPGTPEEVDKGEDLDEVDEELLEEEIPIEEVNKEALMDGYFELSNECGKKLQANGALQHRIAEYFHRNRNEEQEEMARRTVTDSEQRYVKCMGVLENTQMTLEDLITEYKENLAEAVDEVQQRQEAMQQHWLRYVDFRTETALKSVSFRTGKLMQQMELDELHAAEQRKEEELQQIRLAHIQMRNKLKRQEAQLKKEEKLGDGGDLHVIDFEQLKIENQAYSEKIEERNDEVVKMRKKIESSIQMLAHVKEKLTFVQEENTFQVKELKAIEGNVKEKRNSLNEIKHVRDAVRFENTRLRQQSGLLGRESLLYNFQEKQDKAASLRQQIEQLREQQQQLSDDCKVIRQKLQLAQSAVLTYA